MVLNTPAGSGPADNAATECMYVGHDAVLQRYTPSAAITAVAKQIEATEKRCECICPSKEPYLRYVRISNCQGVQGSCELGSALVNSLTGAVVNSPMQIYRAVLLKKLAATSMIRMCGTLM